MAYVKTVKPKMNDYLKRQQGSYLLLEHGGRIVIRRGWQPVARPTAVYTKVAKPAIP